MPRGRSFHITGCAGLGLDVGRRTVAWTLLHVCYIKCNFHRTYKEMSAARDATQTVKQKFDVLTELIEDIDQKMDLIVARIDMEAPRETPNTPPAQNKFRLPTRLTAIVAASVATVIAFTATAYKSS